jgi:dipeptidyl-peptidase III
MLMGDLSETAFPCYASPMKLILFALIATATTTFAQDPKSTIHTQGAYVVKQLVTPDFDLLPLPRKIFAYHLANAIEAGRDLVWIQKSKEGLEIRELLHDLWAYKDRLSETERDALVKYLFKLYKYTSNYSDLSNEKFVLDGLSQTQFLALVDRVGASILKDRAVKLSPAIFDMNYQKVQRAPETSQNQIGDSNVNLYGPRFSDEDYKKLSIADQNNLLTYPLKHSDGSIEVTRQMIGGRFDRQLRLVNYHFEKAKEVGDPKEKSIIEAYQKALRTGDSADLLAADTLWVQHKPADLDFAIGFVESYMDPKGVRGTWEGTVLLFRTDKATIQRVEAMRANAAYFESKMPVNPEYRKTGNFEPPKAESAYLVYVGGDSGGMPYLGKNLPNDDKIRENYGSKSWGSYNVMNDIGPDEVTSPAILKAFYLPKYQSAIERLRKSTGYQDIQVEFHEILGHGSGRTQDGVNVNDLGGYYSPIEEARAEVASLYHFLDPKIMELGIVPKMSSDDFGMLSQVILVDFFTGQIRGYNKQSDTAGEDSIRQAHRWARQMMLNRMISDGALRVVIHENAPKIEILDLLKAKSSLARLWDEIQTIKSTADVPRAERLLLREGKFTREQRGWRSLVVKKIAELNLPTEAIYLNPNLSLIVDAAGKITDVKLQYSTASNGLETVIEREKEMANANYQSLNLLCGPALGINYRQ